MPPDVTARQDEAIMSDIVLFDRQVGYRQWAKSHPDDVIDDDFDEDTDTSEPFGDENNGLENSAFGVISD